MKHSPTFSIVVICFLIFSSTISAADKKSILSLTEWEVGYHEAKDSRPKTWLPAIVPGAVQLDYARAENWKPFYWDNNWKDYRWMEDVFWTYKTTFTKPDLSDDERLFFISKGIDYEFDILLNGEKLFYQEGMFTPVEMDLTDELMNENTLEVLIYPAPKIPGLEPIRDQASQSCKPAASYGWDWHPRLIPLGIWDETFLEARNETYISDFFTNYKLNEEFSQVGLTLQLQGNNLHSKQFEWKLFSPTGNVVLSETGKINDEIILLAELQNPKLWWPHDHGEQPLYTSEVVVKDEKGKILDKTTQTVGFRRVKLVMNEGLWKERMPYPKSRNKPPITIEINGRRIFSKGTNWVNPEVFPGTITRKTYDTLTDLALEANFNMLRIWGGAIVNKESFYELCNEKGILVWTEFPLACNNYVGTAGYLETLQQESESIIKRIRKHPSNAMWSGGNELFNGWSGMTDQSLALRLLNSQCYQLDPLTPFIPTSPIYGIGHGGYSFRNIGSGEEVYQTLAEANNTAYTEFGVPGPASVEILKTIIPEDELFPPKAGTSWDTHHTFTAEMNDSWLKKYFLTDYFGMPDNLKDLVKQGNWAQSEGYKCIYEEARRQKPWCAMALNWCFNEPWPTSVNNSIISYPAEPKPAFYAVAESCRPVLASARIPKFRWKAGETFKTQLYILNDKYQEIKPGKVGVSIRCGNKTIKVGTWEFNNGSPNENIEGPTVEAILPDFNAKRMTLLVKVENHPEWNSEYDLLFIGD